MEDRPTFDSPETLPDLAADLERLVATPHAADRIDPEMRRLINGHFGSTREQVSRHRFGWRARLVAGAGLAAVVAVGAVLVVPGMSRRPAGLERSAAVSPAPIPPPPSSLPAAADLDGDGVVDILDAYRLARHIESGAPLDGAHDLNGDGRVDRNDVRFIALEAVRLPEGTG